MLIRRGGGGRRGYPPSAATAVPRAIDHISFGIAAVRSGRGARPSSRSAGSSAREDTGDSGDIHTSQFKSYHTTTPSGFDLQISSVTKANRSAGAGAPGLEE